MDQPTAPQQIASIGQYNPTTYGQDGFNPWNINQSSSPASSQYGYGTQMPGYTDPGTGITQQQGQNGYQGGYQVSNVQDPYAAQIQWGQNQAAGQAQNYTQQLPGMQQGLQQQQAGMQQYQNSVTPYPSYPNAAGAGLQNAGAQQSNPSMGSGGAQSTGAYGLTPWSLTGEALTRK